MGVALVKGTDVLSVDPSLAGLQGQHLSMKQAPAAGHLAWEQWSRLLLEIQNEVIAAVGDLDRVMNAVVNGALRIIPRATGSVVEMQDGDFMVFRAASGSSLQAVGVQLPMQGSLSGLCIQTGDTYLCSDTETDPRVHAVACREIGIRSMIVVPLNLQGVNVGVLKVHSRHPHVFTQADILTTQLLAGSITIGFATAARAEAARANVEATKRFEATFAQAAVGISHVGLDGQFLLVNDRFCEISGWGRGELIAGGFQQITHPDDLEADIGNVNALLAGEMDRYAMEKRYVRKDGRLVWVNLTVALIRDAAGSPDFFVSVIEDISARKEAEQAAMHDMLTGLPNRRLLLGKLSEELHLRQQLREPLCVAYIDLDGFKAVNDRFGHAEGDQCLVSIAEVLKRGLRKDDVVGRMAGDEFVVLLPNTSRQDAEALLERLRQMVVHASRKTEWNVSASVGAVVVHPDVAIDAEHALIAADQLMYRGKNGCSGQQVIDELLAVTLATAA